MSPRGHKPAERDAPQTSDAELMQQLAKGQLGALGELYDRYQAGLRSFLGRATRVSQATSCPWTSGSGASTRRS